MLLKSLVTVVLVVSAVSANRLRPKKVTKNQAKPFWDPQLCIDFPEYDFFPHDNCEQFWECDEYGDLLEQDCPEDYPIFDVDTSSCQTSDVATCWADEVDFPDPEIEDSECPLDTDEISFLPGEGCDEYYICVSGTPLFFRCREGQHWNMDENYCDDIDRAGCQEVIPDKPTTLPECRKGFKGTLPHPRNCNWFIYCENENRSIQQCQHLFHFDVAQNRCLFSSLAKCIKDV